MMASEWRGVARFLRRQWVSTVAAMVVVGVAVSLSAVTFELADAGLWRSLPYRDPDALVALVTVSERGEARVSVPDFLAVRDRLPDAQVAAAGAFVPDVALTGFGEPRNLKSRVLSAGYFATLGATPVAGRDFARSDEGPGREAVVIITDALWQTLFGRRPSAVGELLMLNGRAHTVVGVLPPMRDYLGPVDLYVPMQFPPTLPRRLRLLEPVARAPVSTEGVFGAAVAAATNVPDDPDAQGHAVGAVRLGEHISSGAKGRLLALFAAGLALLVVAVANVSALIVARARQRASEFALRRTLGASSRAILAIATMDAVAIVTGGAFVGVMLGASSLPAVSAAWGADLLNPVSLGPRVLAWIGVVSSVLLAVAIAAIVRSTRTTDWTARTVTGRRPIARVAVIGQMAVATALVAVAVLLARDLGRTVEIDPGFHIADRYVSRVSLPVTGFPTPRDRERFWDTLVRGLHEASVGAALASELPLTGEDNPTAFSATTSRGDTLVAKVRSTSPGYLEFMRIPLAEGRYLSASDGPDTPWVVVVNHAMARLVSATGPALGQRLSFDFGDGARPATVVGIVADVRHTALNVPPEPEVYFTLRQTPLTAYSIVLTADRGPSRARDALASVLRALDPGRPFAPMTSYRDVIARALEAIRLDARLMSMAAVAATLVATAGVYALLSWLVSSAARDWAIRLAIGASPARLRRSVLGRACVDLACSSLAGVGLAWALAGLVSPSMPLSHLPDDLWAVTLTLGVMSMACIAAAIVPAVRIGRIAPSDLLRA